ncbi:hypothetical protein CPB84DRAFT_1824389 [Gymnopilus junonius]|uniref:Uncharacterized protein n=1 Tax=Gymnopilus junonius TaxID=109634 RepID=A0A9P5TN62_GYMJU|nr:hypothetical protein CPB84DRAFT_1824389 [Gymnopilus junonius]
MLRSPVGIQVGNISLTSGDILHTLEHLMDSDSAASLLNPADKQNVPKAINLIQSLHEISSKTLHDIIPSILGRMKGAAFIANVLSYFLFPFIDVQMTLLEQLSSLSTYSHLITALYRMHRLGFLTSALLADSQAIVKSIIFNIVQLQLIDPDINYYILFEGTDRLENVFSHARTQDHARNFDILQLAQKLSISAEIDAIFQRYPDLDRGHIHRNLVNARGVDHINPKSWLGNVHVRNVNIQQEYLTGVEKANQLMIKQFGHALGYTNFDALFSDPEMDHLHPGGTYVGFKSSEEDEEDEDEEDEGACTGNLLQISAGDNEFEDARDVIDIDADAINTDAEDLNPSIQKEQLHYLTVNGHNFYLPTLVKEFLSADKERCQLSTVRGLRACGVKIAQSLRGTMDGINSSGDDQSSEGHIKAGDLGAVLVHVDHGICMAVIEVLNFRQGSSKINLSSVDIDDLDESGSKAVSLAIQFLEILPQNETGNETKLDIEWWWSKKYVQIQDSKDKTFQMRKFALWIPGIIFHLLAPNVCYDGDDNAEDGDENAPTPTWSLQTSELRETFNCAWNEMDPDSENIVENIKSLPEIPITSQLNGLPYKLYDSTPQFYLAKDDLPVLLKLTKISSTTKVDCCLCKKTLPLQNMRNHVRIHLLKAWYNIVEKGVDKVENNACGWCRLQSTGCETHISMSSSKITTMSNCKYHYKEMKYSKAAEYSDRSPCTNVPIHCALCPIDSNGAMMMIWKYNLKYHLDTTHIPDTGERPTLPLELIVTSHITREEELKMGIEPKETDYYRASEGIPNSDDIEEMVRDDREGRKRGVSDVSVSTTYSESHQPSPSKTMHRYPEA